MGHPPALDLKEAHGMGQVLPPNQKVNTKSQDRELCVTFLPLNSERAWLNAWMALTSWVQIPTLPLTGTSSADHETTSNVTQHKEGNEVRWKPNGRVS